MMKRRYVYMALLLSFSYACSAVNHSAWEVFLKQPNKNSFLKLSDEINVERCGWGNPENHGIVPAGVRKQLFTLIASGNESAFEAGLFIYRCLDGGDLEDFYRNAGLFFEVEPHAFLSILTERKTPESDVKFMLTNLPLDAVDNIDRAIQVIKNRRKLLKNIGGTSVAELKNLGLSFLEQEQQNLNRIKMEMSNEK